MTIQNIEKLKLFGNNVENLKNIDYKDVITLKGLKKSMAMSIGNAIRRTILQYSLGYGIISFKIFQVNHEFSSLFGIKEDIQRIILNLSNVVFKGEQSSAVAKINIKKAGIVLAKDIVTNLTIVNPDEYICTLTENVTLDIEMNIRKSNSTLVMNQIEIDEVNSIIPSVVVFSPIINVNLNVIEHFNNTEDLEMEIITNGSVTPKQVFDYAYSYLLEEMKNFSSYEVTEQVNEVEVVKIENSIKYLNILNKKIIDFIEKDKIVNCLLEMGIEYLGQLVQLTEEDLLKKPKFGKKSIEVLIKYLNNYNLNLNMKIDWQVPKNNSAVLD